MRHHEYQDMDMGWLYMHVHNHKEIILMPFNIPTDGSESTPGLLGCRVQSTGGGRGKLQHSVLAIYYTSKCL